MATFNPFVGGGAPGAAGVIQTDFQEQTIDVSTSSTTFVTLLTSTFTTTIVSTIKVQVSFAASNTTGGADLEIFRIVIDGTPQRGASMETIGGGAQESGSIIVNFPAGPLAHTILLEWRVSSGVGQIRPVSAPDLEHASMLIWETVV